MKFTFIRNIIAIIIILQNVNIAQISNLLITKKDTFKISYNNIYNLSAVHILPTSEKLTISNNILKINDYKLDLENNSISISDSLNFSIFDTLIVEYKSYNLELKKSYSNRKLIVKYDEKFGDSLRVVASNSVDLSSKSIFGNKLKSNGTLLRGFSLGTNKDLSVNSGLRLQLSGQLSEDIEIVAALTDENTPIQPEGNTERLEELDKVFIEIKHKNANAIFGDYNYTNNIGEFGKVNRKLQGAIGNVKFENYGGSFSFASSRGKFNSMSINGIDGVQGPYRLSGSENENDIIIIAGSEQVFLDGKKLKRGENNDYTIEYSNGEVFFTPKVLITSLSRIIIDYEYTNRQYERNVIGANGFAKLFDSKVKIMINAFQEGDNKNSPIDIALSDEDKDRLKDSGDDKLKSFLSGVKLADENSPGIYSSLDTLIEGTEKIIYKYSPGQEDALYNVQFSFIGENSGDYIRESIGMFKFVGANKGSYLPVKLLPLPETNRMGNVVLEYAPINEININLELATSSYDRNTFSNIDDNDNNGFARTLKLDVKPIIININNKNYGKISGSYKDRFIDNKFKSIDRINEIEFNRNYNTSNSIGDEEILRELKINYLPIDGITLYGQYGILKKGNNFNSNRYLSSLSVDNYNNVNLTYNIDLVNTDALIKNSNWFRQNGELSYNIWKLKPGFSFRSEVKKENFTKTDSLLLSSKKFYEYSPFMFFNISSGLNFIAKYTFTKEEAPDKGLYIPESKSYGHTYSVNYRKLKEFKSSNDLTFRKKKYSEEFSKKGFGNNESIQIRSQNQIKLFDRFIDGNIFYQASSERSAKLERVFIRVPKGTGAYSYLGDSNKNGIAEESEFYPDPFEGDFIQTTVPTDELFPVIDLKVNSRWKLDFKKYFKKKDLFNTIMKTFTTETTFRVEENSRISDTKKIYLLKFKHFLNDSTTVRGFNYFQQDVFLFKNQRSLSVRFRFTERNSLNQFSSGLEKAFSKQRSARVKFRMVKEINNVTEYINNVENVLAPKNTNRSRTTNSDEIKSDFSYRPYSNLEIGFFFNVMRLQDDYPDKPTIIDENKLGLRLTLSLLKRGRLRIEFERTELLTNNNDNIIPFEITNGNLIGKNYLWRTNFDYRFSSNLQANLNYIGRLQGKGKVINTLTAEARAYF